MRLPQEHERKQRLNSQLWPAAAVKADRRYTLTAQALHWINAALMFIVLPIAWVMMNMPETAHARGVLFTLHKSIGLSILMLVAIRLAWRVRHPAPPLPGRLGRWESGAAVVSHWTLYAILIGMPVSGYLLDATGGYPISYFGLFSVPVLAKSATLASAATWVHVAVGQWLVYALILLHVAATVWHVAVRRDGVLNRILPEQAEHG
jgi:cytochrome b561